MTRHCIINCVYLIAFGENKYGPVAGNGERLFFFDTQIWFLIESFLDRFTRQINESNCCLLVVALIISHQDVTAHAPSVGEPKRKVATQL